MDTLRKERETNIEKPKMGVYIVELVMVWDVVSEEGKMCVWENVGNPTKAERRQHLHFL